MTPRRLPLSPYFLNLPFWGRKNGFRKSLLASVSFLFLGGCESAKEPLSGVREAILLGGEDLKPDPDAQNDRLILSPALENKAWPQPGAQPNHCVPPLALSSFPQEAWTTSIGRGSSRDHRILSGPVTDGTWVFTLDTEGIVTATQASTGEIAWQKDILEEGYEKALLGGGVSYDQEHLYVSSPIGEVLCLKAETGEILWRKLLGSPTRTPPTIYQGRVFVITINNEVVALESATGNHLWTHKGIRESAGLLGGASPAASEGVVIVPYSSGEIYALRADNGHQLWADSFASGRRIDYVSTMAQIKARPIIEKGQVYVISNGGHMAAIDLRTGGRLWSRDLGGTRSPALEGNFLFLITHQQDLVCLRASDGKIKWTKPLPRGENKDTLWTGPLLVNDQLLVTSSEGKGLFLDAQEGSLSREIDLGGSCQVSPIIAHKTLYFLLDNGLLSAWK